MIGKMFSLGFEAATLPALLTYRSTRAVLGIPGELERIRGEFRQLSDEVGRGVQVLLASVDADMRHKTAHLSAQQKQQALDLALDAAEQHLSMAALNTLRALWLALDSGRELRRDRTGIVIEHEQ